MQSEFRLQAVPTAADAWTDMGTAFTVPANVKRIKKVVVGIAPDWGTTAISVRHAPIFRLTGSGIIEQSPHVYLGVFGGISSVTSGGATENNLVAQYDVDIPVQTGGTITAQCNTLDEAVTAGSTYCNLFYDNESPSGNNSQSDWVDSAVPSAADAFSTVGTLTVPVGGGSVAPKRIKRISIGCAVDNGTSGISLRNALRIRLTGSGIAEGGSHDLLGAMGTMTHITAAVSVGCYDQMTLWYDVDIPVNPSGQILVEQQFDVELPTASTTAVGVHYG